MPRSRSCFDFLGGSSMRWPGKSYYAPWVLIFTCVAGTVQSMVLTILGNVWHRVGDRTTCLVTRDGMLTVTRYYPVVYANVEDPDKTFAISGLRKYITVLFITVISPLILVLILLCLLSFHIRVGIRNRTAIYLATAVLAGYISLAWQLAELRIDGYGVTSAHSWCWQNDDEYWKLWEHAVFRKHVGQYGIGMCAVIGMSLAFYIALATLAVVINRWYAQLEAENVRMIDLDRSTDRAESGRALVAPPGEGSVTTIGASASPSSASDQSRSGVRTPEAAVKANEAHLATRPLVQGGDLDHRGDLGYRAIDGRRHDAGV